MVFPAVQLNGQAPVLNRTHNKIREAPCEGASPYLLFLILARVFFRLPNRAEPACRRRFRGNGHVFRFPLAIAPFDKLPRDLRRGEFYAVALCVVVFRRNSKLHLVKPNVLDGLLNLPIYENPPEMAGFLYFAKEDEL